MLTWPNKFAMDNYFIGYMGDTDLKFSAAESTKALSPSHILLRPGSPKANML